MLRTGHPWMSEEVSEYVNIAPSGQLLLHILGENKRLMLIFSKSP